MRFHGVVVFLAVLLGVDSTITVTGDVTTKVGGAATFTCSYDTESPKWHKGTNEITDTSKLTDDTSNKKIILTFASVTAADDGEYICAEDPNGAPDGQKANLKVAMIDTGHKNEVFSTLTVAVSLTCSFTNSPDTVKWSDLTGNEITDSDTNDNYEIVSPGILKVLEVTKESLGKYICTAEWTSASITVEDYVTLKGRYINAPDDEKVFIYPGKTATLTCNVREDQPNKVTWLNAQDADVTGDGDFMAVDPTKEGDDWRAKLTIANAEDADAATYKCKAEWTTPSAVDATHSIELMVSSNKVADDAEEKVKVMVGETAELKCNFNGDKMETLGWVNPGGDDIANGKDRYTVVAITGADKAWAGSLKISKAEDGDKGKYTCKAKWNTGQTLEHMIELEVNSATKLGAGLVLILAFFWNL